jgi:septal ring factor EnvC (AmiA/AmiB activator)
MTTLPLAWPARLGLSAALCLAAPVPARSQEEKPRPPVRVYTNEDLERVHPLRDETGVASVPAEALPDPPAPERPSRRARGEEYWRREAQRVRDRVRAIEAQAAALRSQAEELRWQRRHLTRRETAAAASAETRLESRIATLERRARRLEDELAERARRAGALPGWLR